MNKIFKFLIIMSLAGISGCANEQDPSEWSQEKLDNWYDKGEWLNGWSVTPDVSIDKRTLAVAYYKNPERWNKAFAFLKMHNLSSIRPKRYDLQNDSLFVLVNEYTTHPAEESNYEAHKKYIDIQYVVQGEELIGIAPINAITDTVQEYDADEDIGFYKVSSDMKHVANSESFFIFFPADAHKPNLNPGDSASEIRKVIVKVMEGE